MDRSSIPPKAGRPKISNIDSFDSKTISSNNQKEKEQKEQMEDKYKTGYNPKDISPIKAVSTVSRDKEKPINLNLITEDLKFVRPTK